MSYTKPTTRSYKNNASDTDNQENDIILQDVQCTVSISTPLSGYFFLFQVHIVEWTSSRFFLAKYVQEELIFANKFLAFDQGEDNPDIAVVWFN